MDVYCRADGSGTHAWRVQSADVGDDGSQLQTTLSPYSTASFTPSGAAAPTFVLRQAVASPLSRSLDLTRAVQLYIYQPHDVDQVLEFDRRITDRYSSFWAQHGEFYGGTFQCDGFGPQWIVEVATFDADDPDSADALVADVTPPDDVADIIAECKTLQDRGKPRYVVWLLPTKTAT